MRRRLFVRKRRLRWLLLAGLLVAFLAGMAVFAASLPRYPDEPNRRTDAIVVLTGGAARIDRGFDLLAAEKAERLFISGVYHSVEVEELLELAQRSPAEMQCCIELGYRASDTIGNALETAEWVRHNDIQSLRLVTASYHMPRARLELGRRLPDVEILIEPVFSDGFREEGWWRWRHSLTLLTVEYVKYLAAVVRLVPDQLLGLAGGGGWDS